MVRHVDDGTSDDPFGDIVSRDGQFRVYISRDDPTYSVECTGPIIMQNKPDSDLTSRRGALVNCSGRLTMTCVGICDIPRECISNAVAAATAMRSRRIGEAISGHRPEVFIVLTVVCTVIYAVYRYLAARV